MSSMYKLLDEFSREHNVNQKGFLCVGLVLTRNVRDAEFPVDENDFLADSRGQVKGLGKGAVQRVLRDYGITRVLAEEGGRTSRGSVGNMQKYIAFLNSISDQDNFSLEEVERWWVEKVKVFFEGKPFKIKVDPARSVRSVVRDVLMQAEKRQKSAGGTAYVGAVMQHLVGAKLELALDIDLEHHGFSVADATTDRDGDFQIEQVVIHVTRTPTEALIKKCAGNLHGGLKPLIITSYSGAVSAENLAEAEGIVNRVDVFEIEQFIATNIYEISRFDHDSRKVTVGQLVDKYNAIVRDCETDPGVLLQLS